MATGMMDISAAVAGTDAQQPYPAPLPGVIHPQGRPRGESELGIFPQLREMGVQNGNKLNYNLKSWFSGSLGICVLGAIPAPQAAWFPSIHTD